MRDYKYIEREININCGTLLDKFEDKYVYKYKQFDVSNAKHESSFNDILAGSLYFSSPKKFNDILDAQINLDCTDLPALIEKEGNIPYVNNFTKSITQVGPPNMMAWEDAFDIMNNSNYILSLSELNPLSYESHYMWGLYASNGAGYVVEYNLADLLRAIIKQKFSSENICAICERDFVDFNYGDANVAIFDFLIKSIDYQASWNPLDNALALKNYTKQYKTYFFAKHVSWEYEQELRMVANISPDRYKRFKKYNNNLNGMKFKVSAKPNKIYLGWNFDTSKIANHQNEIEFVKITGKLNYTAKEFKTSKFLL